MIKIRNLQIMHGVYLVHFQLNDRSSSLWSFTGEQKSKQVTWMSWSPFFISPKATLSCNTTRQGPELTKYPLQDVKIMNPDDQAHGYCLGFS